MFNTQWRVVMQWCQIYLYIFVCWIEWRKQNELTCCFLFFMRSMLFSLFSITRSWFTFPKKSNKSVFYNLGYRHFMYAKFSTSLFIPLVWTKMSLKTISNVLNYFILFSCLNNNNIWFDNAIRWLWCIQNVFYGHYEYGKWN